MRNFTIKDEVINGSEKVIYYKGMILPYLDIQMIGMALLVFIGLFGILQFNNSNIKKNLLTSLFSSILFLVVLWWYSLPEMIFYNILRIG
jgi:hypothetical protein